MGIQDDSTEARLRAEISELRQRLNAQERSHATPAHTHGHGPRRPATGTLIFLGLFILALIVVAFFAGFLPHQKRQTELIAQAKSDTETAPLVNVTVAETSSAKSELTLPGNIEALTEAPVLARASGYVSKRHADIGDRVKAGQVLAEIDNPEIGQQVLQAQAALEQSKAGLEQANANLVQAKTNEQLYKTTAGRFDLLVKKGAVSRQENDNYKAQFEAQQSGVLALEKAIDVAKSNVGAAEANLARLKSMQGYVKVHAPFDGVITQRNVDVGALVNEGSTLLFRIAQTNTLRAYVNVPQSDAGAVHVGQPAKITISNLPDRQFQGTVTRTANALDPASRTLLAEVQVPNPAGLLMPGMYAEVNFTAPRAEPPLLIKGDALLMRSDGPQVAVVQPDSTVHFKIVRLGRDYGEKIEVLSGLAPGDRLVINPGDNIQEHVKVRPVLLANSTPKR